MELYHIRYKYHDWPFETSWVNLWLTLTAVLNLICFSLFIDVVEDNAFPTLPLTCIHLGRHDYMCTFGEQRP